MFRLKLPPTAERPNVGQGHAWPGEGLQGNKPITARSKIPWPTDTRDLHVRIVRSMAKTFGTRPYIARC